MKFEQINKKEQETILPLQKIELDAKNDIKAGVLPTEATYATEKDLQNNIDEAINKSLMKWLIAMGERPESEFKYIGDKIFRAKVEPPFIEHIEEFKKNNYGLKGGAARELLLLALGKISEKEIKYRDIDIVRYTKNKDNEIQNPLDDKIAQAYMPDDYATGYGVEFVESPEESLMQADFTMNMLAWADGYIYASGKAIQDTVRGVIRLTKYAQKEADDDYSKSDKLLTKSVRLYLKHKKDWGEAIYSKENTLEDEDAYTHFGVSTFWMGVQLDRAYEEGIDIGDELLAAYKEKGWLPNDKSDQELLSWLEANIRSFGFRYTPSKQERMSHMIQTKGIDKAIAYSLEENPYDKYTEEIGWVANQGDPKKQPL